MGYIFRSSKVLPGDGNSPLFVELWVYKLPEILELIEGL